jgi:hypothetical protein
VKRVEGVEEFIAEERRMLGRVSTGERNTLIAFGVAITLWTLPGLVGLSPDHQHGQDRRHLRRHRRRPLRGQGGRHGQRGRPV